MLTEEKVRDAASAQLLKGEHEAVKAEIEAREETFQTVVDLGEALVQGGHFAANVRNNFEFLSSCAYYNFLLIKYVSRKSKKSLTIYWKNGINCMRLGITKKFILINSLICSSSSVMRNKSIQFVIPKK